MICYYNEKYNKQGGYVMYRIGKEEVEEVNKVIQSGSLFRVNTELREVLRFEKELSQKMGTNYAVCVSSGTASLICALAAMNIGPGDEVMVPAYTFIATALAPLAVGAIPVLVDIDESMTMDVEDLERKITKNTKAIIPVHICGFPGNMDAIMHIAKAHNLKVLEDACQADGGSYKGKRLGTIGDAGSYSFNYYKIITAGEGGALVTNDETIYERAIIYHDIGASFWSYERDLKQKEFTGGVFRVSEITGAVLRIQLTRLDGILKDLRQIKRRLIDELEGVPYIKPAKSYDIEGDCGTTFALTFANAEQAKKFAEFEDGLGSRPIDSDRHVYINWKPIIDGNASHCDLMNPFKMPANEHLTKNCTPDACPTTLDILKRTVYIPLNPDMSEESVVSLICKIKKAAKSI
jgi:dTDP-4-amino-4,6-dideoxygalactose transaminase